MISAILPHRTAISLNARKLTKSESKWPDSANMSVVRDVLCVLKIDRRSNMYSENRGLSITPSGA